jgi:8-hydroxy-5-deazaflavin:NADPH oxidoreductase
VPVAVYVTTLYALSPLLMRPRPATRWPSPTAAEAGDPATPHDERLALHLAGDDAEAKATVAALIDELGFVRVDVRDLAAGRALQPGSPVYRADLTAAQARTTLAA